MPDFTTGAAPTNEAGELATGWLRDLPDFRDYSPDHEKIAPLMKKLHFVTDPEADPSDMPILPKKIDLSADCSPVESQGKLGSCTANAGVGLLEYFQRRAFGQHIDASRLFLYKVTRNLLGWQGDRGAYLRATMGAMSLFGVPPSKYWPYQETKYDEEPPAFCYAFAENYKAIRYFRLDPPNIPTDLLLARVRQLLAMKLPSMFGFTVYSSIRTPARPGEIPLPADGERATGGHAVVAIGYDDEKRVKNPVTGGPESIGAVMIRNSWGPGWGEAGYGWLPYDYILKGLAVDWWTLISADHVDTGKFGL
ncbi:C1 family peptidase [Pseudokordiimonas caeni]|uniref:C1 family peptidase n=1 Tax=Pseudokordiimonas caeni TaxID=2997908 RepID=UPI002811B964|nr:C1 family peptidase [Pseudokordiimonas caeni]